jgi:hypothetical protein
MNDHRTSQRNRTFKAGIIDFGWGGFDCIVRNLSERGASLELANPHGMADRFALIITSERTRKACRVVWRRGQRLGVIFLKQ